jgi:hypothetical protein
MNIVLLKDTVINGSIWPLGSIMDLPDDQARSLVQRNDAMVQNDEAEPAEEKPAPKKKADK